MSWGLTKGSERVSARPGEIIVVADIVLRYRGSEFVRVSRTIDIALKDDAGNSYETTNIYFNRELQAAMANHLAPGEHIRHRYFYTLPENSRGLTLVFSPYIFAEDCESEAVSIPLDDCASPGALPPELMSPDLGLHSLDELLTCGDITFSLVRWRRMPQSERGLEDFMIGEDGPVLTGMDLVILDLLVSNQSKDAIELNAQVGLKDASGTCYPKDLQRYGFRLIDDQPIFLPGEWSYVRFSFKVEPYATGLEMVMDYFPMKASTIKNRTLVALGAEPAAFDEPVQVPGEITLNVMPKGQPVTVGSFEATLTDVRVASSSECSTIEEGTVALELTYTLKNVSSKGDFPSSIFSYIKNGNGRHYADCTTDYRNGSHTEFAPQETVTVNVSFVFADESKPDYWLVLTYSGQYQKVFFSLK